MLKTLAVAAALAVTTPLAAASPEPVAPSIEVPTDDLDLTAAEGLALLDLRLRNAARTVCGRPFVGSNLDLAQRRRCRILTVREARRDARILIAEIAGSKVLAVR
jgi:UrcA family protein